MNQRTQDVIVWDRLPHPDPLMRDALVSVHVPPTTWAVLCRRQKDALSPTYSSVARITVVGGCATPFAAIWHGRHRPRSRVAQPLPAVLSRGTAAPGNGPSGVAVPRPVDLLDRMRAMFRASMRHPLALWFSDGPRSSGYYYLVLTNGASAILRPDPADPTRLTLEDYFFSRAAIDVSFTPAWREFFLPSAFRLPPLSLLDDNPIRRESVRRRLITRFAALDRDTRERIRPEISSHPNSPIHVRFIAPESWSLPERDRDLHPRLPQYQSAGGELSPLARLIASGIATLFGDERQFGEPLTNHQRASVCHELHTRLNEWTRQAARLPAQLATASDAYAQDVCLGLLEDRILAWAGFVAVDEAYPSALDAGAADRRFSRQMDDLLSAIESFDDALQSSEACWSGAAGGSKLLDNCKRLLVSPWRESPPWWLGASEDAGARRTSSYCLR